MPTSTRSHAISLVLPSAFTSQRDELGTGGPGPLSARLLARRTPREDQARMQPDVPGMQPGSCWMRKDEVGWASSHSEGGIRGLSTPMSPSLSSHFVVL
ncbi:hypothetical protein B0H13DRAFT_2350460 [Mycena leptocephala]|nr:hypothetical protein B0H13DRAFT_2350460 [Mycena leptocephala]